MPTPIDDYGTPKAKGLYFERAVERDVQEMLGMVRGLVCDGVLNDLEISAFKGWLQNHPDCTTFYPGKYLAERIVSIYEDGEIGREEQNELYELLCDTVGAGEGQVAMDLSTQLPFDKPVPTVIFDGRTYVFTGGCVWGPRKLCEKAVTDRGGKCRHDIWANEPSTLVIGIIGNRAWIHSSHGRKIEGAVELRDKGRDVQIISEGHWAEALTA